MSMIKGVSVILLEPKVTAYDEFNAPISEESEIVVENVLISPSTTDDIINSTDLFGKKAVYTLAIPKGDTHVWENKKVRFFDETWHVFGFSLQGIDENIPLDWNKKVMVERYE